MSECVDLYRPLVVRKVDPATVDGDGLLFFCGDECRVLPLPVSPACDSRTV